MAVGFQNKSKDGTISKLTDLALSSPVYLLSKKQRMTKFREFVAAHDYELVGKMAKAINGYLPNGLLSVLRPKVQYHKVIYIPRIKKTLTIDGLKETLNDFVVGKKTKNSFVNETYSEIEPIYSSRKVIKTIKR